jgi:hypothetical protein
MRILLVEDEIHLAQAVSEILKKNLLEDCCIPESAAEMTINNFSTFLELRRKLIAQRLKEYYFSL